MKVASIVPQNYLHLLEKDDYLMCLANLIGEPGMERYTEFYRRKASEGAFVIMDNGLIEGNPRPIDELVAKAYHVGASEMVLPDVFKDKEGTLAAVDAALSKLDYANIPFRVMMVPQGSSIEEWVQCSREMIVRYSRWDFTIGVPKVLVSLGGRDARAVAIDHLCEVCPPAKHRKFHLLGCWQTPLEVTLIDKLSACQPDFPTIRGVDSAIPFVYARAGLKMNSQDRPDSQPIDFAFSDINGRLLKKNLYDWRRAADCTRRWL